MGEAKPKGLSRIEIDQLHTYKVSTGSKEEETESKRCVVCLMDFEEKQSVRVLPCLHEYHSKCIDKWLKVRLTKGNVECANLWEMQTFMIKIHKTDILVNPWYF